MIKTFIRANSVAITASVTLLISMSLIIYFSRQAMKTDEKNEDFMAVMDSLIRSNDSLWIANKQYEMAVIALDSETDTIGENFDSDQVDSLLRSMDKEIDSILRVEGARIEEIIKGKEAQIDFLQNDEKQKTQTK